MRKFYSTQRCFKTFSINKHRFFYKFALAIFSIFITETALADYTVPAGSTINASTITAQSGILTINGTLEVTSNTSLLNFTAVVINAPSGQIFWKNNADLTLSASVTFDILNNAPGLQPTAGNGNASTRLYIGSTLIAVQSDKAQNAAFSFEDFNKAGGLPQFTLTLSATDICAGGTSIAILTPVDNNTTFSCSWSVNNGGSISPSQANNVTSTQNATVTAPANVTATVTYTVTSVVTRGGITIATKTAQITVSPKPTLSSATQGSISCAGPININLSGLVAGSTNTINYTIGGVAQTPKTVTANASGNGSFSAAALSSDNGKILSITGISINQNCVTSVAGKNITLSVKSAGSWLGITSNWNDPQNWCSGIPTSTTNVTIPAGVANYPTITSGTVASSGNLVINSGASITINGTLKVAGSITNNGNSFDAINGTIEFNGNTAQSVSGSMFQKRTVKNLKVSNPVALNISSSINDTLNITGVLSFGISNSTLNTNNNLTLKSTAVATASIGDITNGGTTSGNKIVGQVIVERYLNMGSGPGLHGKKWLFLSTPTVGQTVKESWMENGDSTSTGYGTQITGAAGAAAGFDLKTPSPSLKYYDPATVSWVGIDNTSRPVYEKRGYMLFVRGDRSVNGTSVVNPNPVTLRTKGTVFTGDQVFQLPGTSQFASIGNPFASAIDMRKVDITNGSEFFYVWNAAMTINFGLGAYQTYYKDADGNFYNVAGHVQNNYIQSGQAFFVQTTKNAGTLTVKESSKVSTSNNQVMRPASGPTGRMAQLRTNFYSAGADSLILMDGTLQQFKDEFSNEVDENDARKVVNSFENIFVKTKGKDLIVERKATVTETDTIFFNLTNLKIQNYRLEFIAGNMADNNLEGFVEDAYLKTRTPLALNGTTIVDFTVSNVAASYASNRFRIVFKTASVLPVTFTSIKAYQKGAGIEVNWKVENESNMQQYEVEKSINGNQFSKVATIDAVNKAAHSYFWLDSEPNNGYNYYRIRSIDLNGKINYTQVVKVFTGTADGEISVFPNPIVNGVINLHLINQSAGMYAVRLLNPLGQVVLAKKVNHAQGSSTEIIKWDNQSARGIYHLEVTLPTGGTKTIKLVY